MSLKLTPPILRSAYDLLAVTDPFIRWNLPDSEDIEFRVQKGRGQDARLWMQGTKFTIDISSAKNGHLDTMLSSMAHEMVHLHEARCKMRWRGTDHHGAAFRKWAAQVCKVHGFDPKLFY